MCYNCTCHRLEDDMGKGSAGVDADGRAITKKTFKAAADAFGMTEEEAKWEVYHLLKHELLGKEVPHDHPPGPAEEEK